MLRVNKMSIMENVLFVKYLKDVNLPIERSIKQLNKLGAVMPEQNHFIKRIQIEHVNEKELYKENNLLTKEQIKKCSFIFESYVVLHVTMINEETYHFILNTELTDLKVRFKELNESVNYYLANEDKVNKEFFEELNRNLFQLYK